MVGLRLAIFAILIVAVLRIFGIVAEAQEKVALITAHQSGVLTSQQSSLIATIGDLDRIDVDGIFPQTVRVYPWTNRFVTIPERPLVYPESIKLSCCKDDPNYVEPIPGGLAAQYLTIDGIEYFVWPDGRIGALGNDF